MVFGIGDGIDGALKYIIFALIIMRHLLVGHLFKLSKNSKTFENKLNILLLYI